MKYVFDVDTENPYVDKSGNKVYMATSGAIYEHVVMKGLEPLTPEYINENFGDLHEGEYECAYNKGLEDAWECARKIWNMPFSARLNCFGVDATNEIYEMTIHEALAKLTVYEEKKKASKITEGDVVEYTWSEGTSRFIVFVIGDDFCGGLSLDADREVTDGWNYSRIDDVRPTGEHYDISGLLKKIKGGE